MFSIEQSLFLRALGGAIGHSLWQVAALWLAYTAISYVSKWGANRRYLLAATAGLAGFVWFIITLVNSYYTLPPLQNLSGVYAENAAEPESNLPGYLLYIYHSTAVSLRSLMPYISCAYLLLFAVLGIRLTNGFRQVQLFATQGLEKPAAEWRLFVQQHAAALDIAQKVKIFTSQYVQSPLTLGFWKPIILMPVASLAHLTPAQIESILLHELAHIRRHDYLVNIFLQIAETTLFFNPFMRLLLKQVKQERENSCDDYVLKFSYSPKDYAKALLAVEHNQNPALLALAAKGNQSFQLLNRVRRMVAPQPKAFSYRQQLGLLLLLTVLTLGFTVIIPHPKRTAAIKAAPVQVARQKNELKIETIVAADNAKEETIVALPPAFNMIDAALANLSDGENLNIDEAAVERASEQMTATGKEIEAIGAAYGKEMEARIKPAAAQWEAWGKEVAAGYANGNMPDDDNQQALFSQMPLLPDLSAITSGFTQKMLPKLNALLKAIPQKVYADIARNAAAKASHHRQQEMEKQNISTEQVLATQYAEDARQQIMQAQQDLENARLQLQAQSAQLQQVRAAQAVVKQQMAMQKEQVQKLHLGLFTDDRDTTLVGLSGLFAKLDKKRHWQHYFNTEKMQQDVQVHNKAGKCTITIPEIDFSIDSENWNLPANLNLDGQDINIRHDKQVKNGKEEKVVVISIK